MAPKRILLTLLLSTLLTTSGCTTTTTTTAPSNFPSPLQQSSVISTSAPEFTPQRGDTVGWRSRLQVFGEEPTLAQQTLRDGLQARIEDALVAKGYRFAALDQAPDFWLDGILVLGQALEETQLAQLLEFEPGLVAATQRYETGSILLFLTEPDIPGTAWRAAVQMVLDPGNDDAAREHQEAFAIRSLMRPLPAVN